MEDKDSIFQTTGTWILESSTGIILDCFETEGLAKQAQARFLEWGEKTTITAL